MARNKPQSTVQGGATGAPPEELPQAVTKSTMIQPPPTPAVVMTNETRTKVQYRVQAGGYVMVGGLKTGLRTGKIIDDVNYDIPRLEMQGVKLERITPLEPEPAKEAPESKEADSPSLERLGHAPE